MKRENSADDVSLTLDDINNKSVNGGGADGDEGSDAAEGLSGGACDDKVGKGCDKKSDVSMAFTYRGVSRAQAKKITSLVFEKLRQAIQEVDTHLITTTTKTKVIEYNLEQKPDKPTKEILTETEENHAVKGVVDRQGLKQITAILKELKDISLFNAELDFKEQQARVSNLLSQSHSSDDEGVSCGVIIMPAKEMGADGSE